MDKVSTSLDGVFVLEPRVFGDPRGFFLESYNERELAKLGIGSLRYKSGFAGARATTMCRTGRPGFITRSSMRKGS